MVIRWNETTTMSTDRESADAAHQTHHALPLVFIRSVLRQKQQATTFSNLLAGEKLELSLYLYICNEKAEY
jgi:hypothetical protein